MFINLPPGLLARSTSRSSKTKQYFRLWPWALNWTIYYSVKDPSPQMSALLFTLCISCKIDNQLYKTVNKKCCHLFDFKTTLWMFSIFRPLEHLNPKMNVWLTGMLCDRWRVSGCGCRGTRAPPGGGGRTVPAWRGPRLFAWQWGSVHIHEAHRGDANVSDSRSDCFHITVKSSWRLK